MTKWKIYNQDVIEWAKSYDKGKFHALMTDAPYHLTSIVKRFGKTSMSDGTQTSEKVRGGVDAYSRLIRTGFMGNTWDGGDIAFRPETWVALGEHLYPGAFGMVFSASRNWHRLAVAIEDAGFVLHPTIFFLWVQGQGFPKATKVRADGFDGYKYGLQALKPSVEPIIMFQKPYEGRPIDNIVQTGAGVLNIDGTRIPTEDSLQGSRKGFLDGKGFGNIGHGKKTIAPRIINRFSNGAKPWGNAKGEEYETVLTVDGRYPANLILDEESAGRLDQQTESETSRFFFRVQEQIDEADPFYYHAKVNPKERNAGLDEKNPHPTLKPIGLMKYLATLLLPPAEYAPRRIMVPFSGVSSEMIGAGLAGWEHVVGIEFKEEYVDIGKKRLEYWLNERK